MISTDVTRTNDRRRTFLRNICAAMMTLSGVMLVLSVVSAMRAGADALPAGSAPTAGLTILPLEGNSSTEITLSLAAPNNACPGDTATDGYKWQTFMVPASVNASALTYKNGPVKTASIPTAFPLYSFIGQSSVVNKNTAVETGQIVGTSTTSFSVFTPGQIAAGDYKIGYACSKAPAAGQNAVTERFWEQVITVTADEDGGPAEFSWTAQAPSTTTTTTTTSTTTTTIAGGSTTTSTTVAGGSTTTSTTVAGGSTTTSTTAVGSAAATSTTLVGSLAASSGVSSSGSSFDNGSNGTIPVTGRDELPIIVWGVLLVVFGRMAILLARPIRVIPIGPA